ncbi:MAG: hypothetical protein Ct9H300mP3_05400 [Gammaproteobacteria bacterium]|nr:MAG: hypothetical protein Ct9H300mP3_05400 [Gammaproteobacteria bacterium]
MKIGKDQEIICGINVIETVLNLRPESAKTLFVLDSKSNPRIKKILSSAKTNQIEIFLKRPRISFQATLENKITKDWLCYAIKELKNQNHS